MRILLDENVPKKFKRVFPNDEVFTVTEMGWAGIKNGALLKLAEGEFEVMVTVDKSIPYQNNFTDKQIILLTFLVKQNKIEALLPLVPAALEALSTASPGQIINISSESGS
jgi:predicted nuclease of predicted toxin-antitoxin system